MKERLLFDGIELESADIAAGYKERSAAIESHTADAIEAVEYDAAMSASQASQFSRELVKRRSK